MRRVMSRVAVEKLNDMLSLKWTAVRSRAT